MPPLEAYTVAHASAARTASPPPNFLLPPAPPRPRTDTYVRRRDERGAVCHDARLPSTRTSHQRTHGRADRRRPGPVAATRSRYHSHRRQQRRPRSTSHTKRLGVWPGAAGCRHGALTRSCARARCRLCAACWTGLFVPPRALGVPVPTKTVAHAASPARARFVQGRSALSACASKCGERRRAPGPVGGGRHVLRASNGTGALVCQHAEQARGAVGRQQCF